MFFNPTMYINQTRSSQFPSLFIFYQMLGCLLSGDEAYGRAWNAGVLDEGNFSFLQEADTGTQPAGTKACALVLSTSQVHAVYCRCTLGLDLKKVLGIVLKFLQI